MKKTFSLIELLVVIAILAILAALLFPVFAGVQQKAKSANCQSNLKQIAVGLRSYELDYRYLMPPGDWSGNVPMQNTTPMEIRPTAVAVHWYLKEEGYIRDLAFFLCPQLKGEVPADFTGFSSSYSPNMGIFAAGKLSLDYPSGILLGDGYSLYRLRCKDWSFRWRHGNAQSNPYSSWVELGYNTSTGTGNYLFGDGAIKELQAKERSSICRDLIVRRGQQEIKKIYKEEESDHPNCGSF